VGDAGEILEAGHQEVLPVVALGLAVEAAAHPAQRPGALAAAAPASTDGLGVVVERRVERVDVLGQADAVAGDAGGERRRVADDVTFAVHVRGDRGERDAVLERVGHRQVGERHLVGEGLGDLGELLAVADVHRRPGGGERVGEDVVEVHAVPAVRVDLLVDDARRDGEAVAGLVLEGDAAAGAVAVVDVLLDVDERLDGVDEAAVVVVEGGHAQRRRCRRAAVERHLAGAADAAARVIVSVSSPTELRAVELGLVR
jgi:hypothetical protein